MAVAERIKVYVQQLPETLQAEVLDFVEYLMSKQERNTARQEEMAWADLSLALAMRGMEDEDRPVYTTADLKSDECN